MQASNMFIGLMSGTSLDSIDAALVSFVNNQPKLEGYYNKQISHAVRAQILHLNQSGQDEIEHLATLDPLLGHLFADACLELLEKCAIAPSDITAIGSHGQTLRHRPNKGYSLQIGDPNVIAERTGITTIADFRRRDLAAGGQGAPLVPAFHATCFRSDHCDRVIVNIGGMANITLLPANQNALVLGYDTGPGNVLLDAWALKHLNKPYDAHGEWARSGKLCPSLLNRFMSDPFFALPFPKSTGRELFNTDWLNQHLDPYLPPEDVERTLTELTAISISDAIQSHSRKQTKVFVCGGGSHNTFLLERIRSHLNCSVSTTKELGLDPDWVEACAFAWLAYRTINHQTGNLKSVTGAKGERVLGGIYLA